MVQYFSSSNITTIDQYFDINTEGEIIPINTLTALKQNENERFDSDVYLIMGYNRVKEQQGSINDITITTVKKSDKGKVNFEDYHNDADNINKVKPPSKKPNGYSNFIDGCLLFKDGMKFFAIKRRKNPICANFKGELIQCYPPSMSKIANLA